MGKSWRCKLSTLDEQGEVISTDVLIIGGGIGGLVAAIKAKEGSPSVNVLIGEADRRLGREGDEDRRVLGILGAGRQCRQVP
jgi:2-polyprenyl-6-methoxyphenol hydroxylase-like FAD-dependent oxidoreductase